MTLLEAVYINAGSWVLFLFGLAFPIYLIFGYMGLTGFKDLTRYEEAKTFYYRLNPLTKIAFTIVLTFVVAVTAWSADLALGLIILVSYLSLRRGFRKLLLGSALAFASVVGLAWTFSTATPYTLIIYAFTRQCLTVAPPTMSPAWLHYFTPLWTWASYFQYWGFQPVFTLQGLLYGLQVSTRTGAVLLAALILVMTSTPSAILRSLGKLKLPIVLIFALVVGLRTVPRIFDSLDTAVKVQFMRGYGSRANKATRVFYLFGGVLSSIVPAMTFLFRGAQNTAISADTRAFRAYKDRTFLTPFTFSREDYILFAVVAALVVFAVVSNIYGFGRAIPYSAVGSSCGATSTA
ncbi:MAG: energy-coupling factor transporter transmembrane protein EcfT [Nitrososphaerota archaeon]|nr:energy-coupling factor transporter transmembrane protein EcfT [Nitrososphaerota archaeon]MDG6955379.1 energy-coupling factor transporter transmembrane protein EcfT [Nitrososphaerota archaeon]MDG6981235.1 energy-coupling factor transporter transmembrane protein EcfT [Nitrososphaerota archaeon]